MKRWSLLLAFAALALGCAPGTDYDGLSFDPQSSPPVPVSFESDRIEIPVGIAVKVKAKPHSDGRDYESDDLLSLRPDDEEVLAVYNTSDARSFVFVGLREGKTCVQVRINRHEQECIDVRVLPAE
jgi:hypothetical protein